MIEKDWNQAAEKLCANLQLLIKERMKFQDLEFLHQKMVSQQLFAVPFNDFSSIVECVKSGTSEHRRV